MTPQPPTRSQRAAQVLAGSLVFVVIGAVANVLQIFSFGTGWDLPDIIERLRPPATTAPAGPPATGTPASKKPTAKASSAAPTGKPKARTTTTRPPQTSAPEALTVPSDAEIKSCLEQRVGWDTAQEAYGVTEADLGARVTVRIKVSPADKAYTFWQTDEDCALRAVVRVSPGQSRTITTWGGAMWDLARGSADPRVDGPGPISRPRSADLFTFEVGSTTVRYSF
ncbi:hypothetical protein [Paractinoplanes brasiliensis]|uniref:Uncharacterized protein n=1 Tax=Paractinoplanes brasiliensis TaxID=52695 RepID=A0A4R6JAJ9_9ACTN|nr:hypothetical protein [Actinoplanes brasiliensis]TDO32723.1 hypothetical protein C8E87_8195 [Actinoplanes brasiliensis]GID32859.1 hypothetical protein Abr02nite_78420 [Actinoplanes brasiliensis]